MAAIPALLAEPSPPEPTVPPSLDRIEAVLVELVADLEPEPAATGRGRPRILPALALGVGFSSACCRGGRRSRRYGAS